MDFAVKVNHDSNNTQVGLRPTDSDIGVSPRLHAVPETGRFDDLKPDDKRQIRGTLPF